MVWDSRRGRALLFGGDGAFGVPYPGTWQSLGRPDTLPSSMHWEPLVTTTDGPPARSGMCAVYDSAYDRVLLFGGRGAYGDQGSNELWQLRLDEPARWLRLDVAPGTVPAPRFDATMILDRDRRLVLYGGDGSGGADDAVWFLPLTDPTLQWRKMEDYIIGPGPGPRARHSAAYSASRNRMLVFGGERLVVGDLGSSYAMCAPQAWEIDLDPPVHWQISNPFLHPVAEVGGALQADTTGRYAWLLPGNQAQGVNGPAIWRYDLDTHAWTRVDPGFGGPGPRGGIASCMDRSSGDVVVHGGTPAPLLDQGMADEPLAETWGYITATAPGWITLCQTPGVLDRPWGDPRAHFDAARRQLVTWTREGLWACDVAGDATWHLDPGLATQNVDAMSTIDPVRRRLLVFGGAVNTDTGRFDTPADQLWSWRLDGPGGWSITPITGPVPSNISGTQCAFDVARNRVIVLPSNRDSYAPLDTLPVIEFAGDAAHWASLPVAGNPPPPRTGATVVMDPIHDRLFLQGGATSLSGDGSHARDLWSLSLSGVPTWHLEIFSPFGFEQAAYCGFAVDPTLGRMMLVGGEGLAMLDMGHRHPIESTSFDDPATWENLDPTNQSPMTGAGTMSFDAVANRMLWWNGRQLWEITWPFATPPAFGPATVNADPGGVHVRWQGEASFDPYVAAVDRSSDGGRSWSRLRSVAADHEGVVAFTDSSLAPGAQAAYRATIERAGSTITLGTASTVLGPTLPASLTLAAPRPNPARDDVALELGAPAGGTVTFELFDVSGRLAAPAVRRTVPAGVTVFTVPLARGLLPGLYMLRASDGRQKVSARLFVVR